MFIQTEATPNPATLKFLPGCEVMPSGSANMANPEEAEASPLARRLFEVNGVTNVYLGADFISVSKGDAEWHHIKPAVLGVIMEHFQSGQPVMNEAVADGSSVADGDSDVVVQIKDLLDTRVRPAVAQDGGDITFHGYEDGVVFLHMQGACAGCPSSTMTLKHGIENLLRHYIPEVLEVRAV